MQPYCESVIGWVNTVGYCWFIIERFETQLWMHGNSPLPGVQLHGHQKAEQIFACLARGNKQVQRQRVRRQTERRRKRKRGRMNSMFSAVPSDIRLSGFKHQHIKFSGVSSSYCEIQSGFQHVLQLCPLSKSHVPSLLSMSTRTDILGFWII